MLPPPGGIHIYTDAAFSRAQGRLGIGISICEDGEELLAFAKPVAVTDELLALDAQGQCNVIEYYAILVALELAVDFRLTDAVLRCDCDDVVKEVTCERWWKRRSPSRPLRHVVRSALQSASARGLFTIPRRENRRADALAKRALYLPCEEGRWRRYPWHKEEQ
jgi:ribonuclease HI